MRAVYRRIAAAIVVATVAVAMVILRSMPAPSSPPPGPPVTSPPPIALDGQLVVSTASCPTFAIADPTTGATTLAGECGTVHLAPDGRSILRGRSGVLSVEDLATGATRVLRSDPGHSFEARGWSARGRYMMWDLCSTAGTECDWEHVWIGEASETPTTPDVTILRPESITWSADDSRISIAAPDDAAPAGVWATGTGAGGDRRPFDGRLPIWSPDGSRLAYTPWWRFAPKSLDVIIARADGSDPRVVATLDCCPGGLFWSPDGTTIVARVEDPEPGLGMRPDEFVATGLDGGVRARASVPAGGVIPAVEWSPAGDRFLIPSGGSALVVSTDSSEKVDLGPNVAAAWSPDGSQLAVIERNGGNLRIVAATDGSTIRILERPAQGFVSELHWLP